MAAADSPRKKNTNGTQRRHNKPLIEKRRRARINECLAQLQSLVLKATATEGPRPSKLEKADILEMTVDYIKKTRTGGQANDDASPVRVVEPEVQQQYAAGYEKCIKEVLQFLEKHNTVGNDIREKITSHCQDKLQEKSSAGEPMEGVKCERHDEEESMSSAPSSPELPPLVPQVDVAKDEVRQPVQNTAYVAPLQHQQHQSSPESSPLKQATVQPLSGQIKLVCGGDILILVDPSSQNTQIQQVPKVQISQPQTYSRLSDVYPTCSVNMVGGSIAPSTIPLPVYKLANFPMTGVPIATPITNSFQPLHIQTHLPNKPIVPQENVIINPVQPLVEGCHVNRPQPTEQMWRPW